TIAFDPSFTGESGGYPRDMHSPDINVEDFQAAVDFLSVQDNVDPERIGIIGICGWGGMALQTACIDTRIKATVTSTMYDMSRIAGNGYFDSADREEDRYQARTASTSTSLMNTRLFTYAKEIRNAVLMIHGDKAHSCYMSRDAYADMVNGSKYSGNKELYIVEGATHTDLYDGGGKNAIPFDKIESFMRENLK
ncbi:MAG: alpha/beta hydrolase, partial [Erysipelotrichaceae bacterium]|nr:alpha/beta hydrolase [Erysipelotrichaceae bacterium]